MQERKSKKTLCLPRNGPRRRSRRNGLERAGLSWRGKPLRNERLCVVVSYLPRGYARTAGVDTLCLQSPAAKTSSRSREVRIAGSSCEHRARRKFRPCASRGRSLERWCLAVRGGPAANRTPSDGRYICGVGRLSPPQEKFIVMRNSAFVLTFSRRLRRSSTASTTFMSLRTRRSR